MQFIFVGPVVKVDPEALPRRANLHWLGAKDYAALPGYMSGWEIAFMPFALNEATRFISPTKTPEFLAAGLPVCSTPVADVVTPYGLLGLVEIATNAADFAAKLSCLSTRAMDGEWLERVDEFLGDMSWDDTWERMWALMQKRSRDTHDLSSQQLTPTGKGAARIVRV
jgi:hypothetical protein